jgi:hypothetical protein
MFPSKPRIQRQPLAAHRASRLLLITDERHACRIVPILWLSSVMVVQQKVEYQYIGDITKLANELDWQATRSLFDYQRLR